MIVTLIAIASLRLSRQAFAHLFIICTGERNDSPDAWQTTHEH
jgi:hypothetical protein